MIDDLERTKNVTAGMSAGATSSMRFSITGTPRDRQARAMSGVGSMVNTCSKLPLASATAANVPKPGPTSTKVRS